MKVSDYILQRLREWDVDRVFGYAGDGINGLLAAWGRAENSPQFIQARHEEMAAFEATGYAKFSGRVGICAATSGPGAVHLLNGLYDAKLDHVPVVAIIGQTNRTAMGGSYQQEIDLASLYKDVASEFIQVAAAPEQFPNLIDRAMRISQARHTVTAIIVPADVQELEYSPPTHDFKMVPSSLGMHTSTSLPGDDVIRRAAQILNEGERVAIHIGQGAREARDEVMELADLLGAGVAKALLGKDVIPDDLPYVTGATGLLGSRPSYEMMRDCDTLLMVGSSFPYAQFLPEFGQARGIEIDHNASFIGLRYPNELNLVGDAKATLRAIIGFVESKEHGQWRQTIEKNVADWWQTVEGRASIETEAVNPLRMFSVLSEKLPDNAIVSADSGSAANWYARQLKFTGNMRGSLSGTLATMGPGVPYAIGAKFADSGRPSIALVGDGAMQMNGMAELLTARLYYEQWDDPRMIVGVINNTDLNQVTWEMRAMAGAPKFAESQKIPEVNYAAFARSIGLDGVQVTSADQLADTWERALAADRPFVVDVVCDPNIPPIPPHATYEQAKSTAEAMAKGDEDAWRVMMEGLKAKAQEFVPHRE